jgi:hypothetical protein
VFAAQHRVSCNFDAVAMFAKGALSATALCVFPVRSGFMLHHVRFDSLVD